MNDKVTVVFNDGQTMIIDDPISCEIPKNCDRVLQVSHKHHNKLVLGYIPLNSIKCVLYEDGELLEDTDE